MATTYQESSQQNAQVQYPPQGQYTAFSAQQLATPTPTAAPTTPSTSQYQQAQSQQPQTQAAASDPGPSTQQTSAPPQSAQKKAEEVKKDKTLAEFLLTLDDYEPLIPSEVTDYYLQRVGFECEDVRLKRLLALAAQKFVSDIAADAYQHARIRTVATGGRSRGNVGGPQSARDKTKTTLMMEDLSAALAEYGITSKKPEFYM
ncbi:transcription initiation factor TFIID 23-30kDa subunit-domain-containing protein [Abortiporus biennis]|nr:transcription initiation factor TFIID 23-30kDa subunit-domain-containing protein [Abortiporus biennis]